MHRSLFAALVIVGLIFLASAALAEAGKGKGGGKPGGGDPPPPLDAGWIYYYGNVGYDRHIGRVSPDGATYGTIAGAPADYGCFTPEPCGGSVGVPGVATHDGDRWYAARSHYASAIVFPGSGGNRVAVDLDVVREGDDPGLRLTDHTAACINVDGGPTWVAGAGGQADAALSWVGSQWQDADMDGVCETFVAAGFFLATLDYDTDGAIVGMDPATLVVPAPWDASGGRPDVRDFDWSPDGSQVAYTSENGPAPGSLRVADLGDPLSAHQTIVSQTLFDVDWSPDQDAAASGVQSTIAVTGWSISGKLRGGVWTVAPDGSGLTLTAEARQGKNSRQTSHIFYTPRWSPAGSHLAYVDYEHGGPVGSQGPRSVRRVLADGSDDTELISGTYTQVVNRNLEWTAED